MTETPVQEQASGAPKPAEQPAASAAAVNPSVNEAVKSGEPAKDAFKSEESKNTVLADLRKERDARQALETKIEAQNKAMLAAFGVTETPKNEDLAETVSTLRAEIAKDRHDALVDRLAAANGIDAEHQVLLTETDPEKLKLQATMVGNLVKAKTATNENPEFQSNPGQGQGGSQPSAEAAADAEYNKFYPTPQARKA